MTPETLNPHPPQYAHPPNWVTPEIPRGFFVSTSRLPSTLMEEDDSSGSADNLGGYPGVDSQCERAASEPNVGPITTKTHTLRKVICTLPPRDAAARTHERTGHEIDGLLPRRKEQTNTKIGVPPQPPQAKRTQTRERPTSTLLPPHDPLLHPAMITPPCPIPTGQ